MRKKIFIPVVLTLFVVGYHGFFFLRTPDRPSFKEQENKTLSHFITSNNDTGLSMPQIAERLFDIQTPDGTSGRAFLIGNGYLITAYHVIREKSNMCAVTQEDRIHGICYPIFPLSLDEKKDLALVYSDADIFQKSVISLFSGTGKMEKFSFLKILSGKKKQEPFLASYTMEEFYHGNKREHKVNLQYHPDSAAFEVSGHKMEYDTKAIEIMYNLRKTEADAVLYELSASEEDLYSFPVFNGDSGSGILAKDSRGNYHYTGVVLRAWNTRREIPTPGNPMGYKSIQATVTFAASASSVETFIIHYINQGY